MQFNSSALVVSGPFGSTGQSWLPSQTAAASINEPSLHLKITRPTPAVESAQSPWSQAHCGVLNKVSQRPSPRELPGSSNTGHCVAPPNTLVVGVISLGQSPLSYPHSSLKQPLSQTPFPWASRGQSRDVFHEHLRHSPLSYPHSVTLRSKSHVESRNEFAIAANACVQRAFPSSHRQPQ